MREIMREIMRLRIESIDSSISQTKHNKNRKRKRKRKRKRERERNMEIGQVTGLTPPLMRIE